MAEIYLDTTVLVEALLKTKKRRKVARERIRQDRSILSVFAIKEFKAGPLQHWIWLYNKLRDTKSLQLTYRAISRNLRAPYRVGTALEAIEAAFETVMPSAYRENKSNRDLDHTSADVHALALRRIIAKAWAEHRTLVDEIFGHPDCFLESAPYVEEKTGILLNPGKNCLANLECGFAPGYKSDPNKLRLLIQAIDKEKRPEDQRRRDSLRKLARTPQRTFDDSDCRRLGDAHFALTCPPTAVILTSNVRDHVRLGNAVGISVEEFKIPEGK